MLLLDRDPDNPDGEQGRRRVLAHVKSNDGPEMPSPLYEIQPTLLPLPPTNRGGHLTAGVDRRVAAQRSRAAGVGCRERGGALRQRRGGGVSASRAGRAGSATGRRHDQGREANRDLGAHAQPCAPASLGVETEKTEFLGGAGQWEWWLSKKSRQTGRPAPVDEGVTPREVTPYVESSDSTPSDEPEPSLFHERNGMRLDGEAGVLADAQALVDAGLAKWIEDDEP